MAGETQPAPERPRSVVAISLFDEILKGADGQKVELPSVDPRFVATRGVRMVGARRSIPIVNYSLEVTAPDDVRADPKRYNLSQIERHLLINGVFTEADEDWQSFIADLDQAKQLKDTAADNSDET